MGSQEKSTRTRRQFLKASLASGAVASGVFINPSLARCSRSPNEKLNLAIVGVGNKGWHNIEQLTHENIVALCDVDSNFLSKAAAAYPNATQYRDYRRMFDADSKSIDAVVVSTADHTHAPVTSVALDLGKHVYCEKPLTHTVAEARVIANLARKNNVATQMGIQIHANNNYRRVVEIIQSGAIGQISAVYSWCNKGWSGGRFTAWDQPTPSHIDWDLWLGPAAQRPYSNGVHPENWRRFWEYGSGTFGDMACHVMDLPFWALGLRHPLNVECQGPELDPVGAPAWVKASYEFPGLDGNAAPLRFHWSDGNAHFDLVEQTKDHSGNPLSRWGLGVLFVGADGMLAADYGRYELHPQEKFEQFQRPAESIPPSIGHWKEWTEACRSGSPTTCNFDYAGALTETVLLGIVAFRCGVKLQWEADRLTCSNVDGAAELLNKHYRRGFEVVGLQ